MLETNEGKFFDILNRAYDLRIIGWGKKPKAMVLFGLWWMGLKMELLCTTEILFMPMKW